MIILQKYLRLLKHHISDSSSYQFVGFRADVSNPLSSILGC